MGGQPRRVQGKPYPGTARRSLILLSPCLGLRGLVRVGRSRIAGRPAMRARRVCVRAGRCGTPSGSVVLGAGSGGLRCATTTGYSLRSLRLRLRIGDGNLTGGRAPRAGFGRRDDPSAPGYWVCVAITRKPLGRVRIQAWQPIDERAGHAAAPMPQGVRIANLQHAVGMPASSRGSERSADPRTGRRHGSDPGRGRTSCPNCRVGGPQAGVPITHTRPFAPCRGRETHTAGPCAEPTRCGTAGPALCAVRR